MNWIPAPLVPPDGDLVPITIYLTPVQATRLELLLAERRNKSPAFDEHSFVDSVFSRGLAVAEQARGNK